MHGYSGLPYLSIWSRKFGVGVGGALILGLGLSLYPAVAVAAPVHPVDTALVLEPCPLPGLEGAARCGKLEVFEDRKARTGRKIGLKVAVLPAREGAPSREPLFAPAGGPGAPPAAPAGPAAPRPH